MSLIKRKAPVDLTTLDPVARAQEEARRMRNAEKMRRSRERKAAQRAEEERIRQIEAAAVAQARREAEIQRKKKQWSQRAEQKAEQPRYSTKPVEVVAAAQTAIDPEILRNDAIAEAEEFISGMLRFGGISREWAIEKLPAQTINKLCRAGILHRYHSGASPTSDESPVQPRPKPIPELLRVPASGIRREPAIAGNQEILKNAAVDQVVNEIFRE